MALLILFCSFSLSAKEFANHYTSFQLPSGWECVSEGNEYVCQSENKDRKKEAIIILGAKIRNEKDSLEAYKSYLSESKTFAMPNQKKQVSEPKYTKSTMVNGHPWVDSLHLASEIPGFYTRYLATVKADLGVAITMSVGKDFYDAYATIFDRVVQSMRVFRQAKADGGSLVNIKSKDADLLAETTFVPEDNRKFDISQSKKQASSGGLLDGDNLYYLLGLLVVVAIIFLKKKKKKKN